MTHEQDDARVVARWLGWEVETRCRHGVLGHCDVCNTTNWACRAPEHLIPPPDFADPAVYDRALRELAARKIVHSTGFDGTQRFCSIWPRGELYEVFEAQRPTIGAAIAAAIAALARAEMSASTGVPGQLTETASGCAGPSDSAQATRTRERG